MEIKITKEKATDIDSHEVYDSAKALELILSEEQYQLITDKYRAAIQLIGRLLNPKMKDDVELYREQLEPWLEKQEIEYNTHAGWCVSALCETPDPKLATKLHMELIQAARKYYHELNSGRDPGDAKSYLDNLSLVFNDDPAMIAYHFEKIQRMAPMLEILRK